MDDKPPAELNSAPHLVGQSPGSIDEQPAAADAAPDAHDGPAVDQPAPAADGAPEPSIDPALATTAGESQPGLTDEQVQQLKDAQKASEQFRLDAQLALTELSQATVNR